MNSGFYIAISMPLAFVAFTVWELVQLARRRAGNKSARTASQYVIHRVEAGSKGWKWFVIIFPFFLMAVGLWLVFHWYSLCWEWHLFCEIDI